MRITLNGEPKEIAGPLTIQSLLESLDIDPRLVAVELNRLVVKRAHYGTAVVEEGAPEAIINAPREERTRRFLAHLHQ